MKVGEVSVDLIAKTDQLSSGLKKAETEAKQSATKISNSFGDIKKAALAAGAVIATSFVFTKAISFFKEAIVLAGIQERAELRLAAVLRATGNSAGYSAEQLYKMAAEMQRVTRYGDEEIIAAQALAATFKNLNGEVFKRTIELAADVAEVMGNDLKSATLQLAKALNDPVTQLSYLNRSGITFNETEKKLIKTLWESNRAFEAQKIVLDVISGQLGGTARAALETFDGQVNQLIKSWGDLKESFGFFITKNPEIVKEIGVLTNAIRLLDQALKDAQGSAASGSFLWSLSANIAKSIEDANEAAKGVVRKKIEPAPVSVKPNIEVDKEAIEKAREEQEKRNKAWEDYIDIRREANAEEEEAIELARVSMEFNAAEEQKKRNAAWDEYLEKRREINAQEEEALEMAKVNLAASEDAKKSMLDLQDVVITVGDGIGDAVTDWILGVKSFAEAWKYAAASIVGDLVKIAVQQLIVNNLVNAVGEYFPSKKAKGGAWYSGQEVVKAAKGTLINGPTILAGERGTEAIMPLGRTASGDLGVKVTGGGDKPKLTVNIINQSGQQIEQSQSGPTWNGEEWVLSVVLNAYGKNKGGFRDIMRSGM
jgi:hypothetical protein